MVKTLLAVVIALAGLSSAANATPSVVLGSPDPDAVYGPGETVTLTVRVTVEGEVDDLVRGDFTFASSLVTPIAVQINGTLPGRNPFSPWQGPPLGCTSSECTGFWLSNTSGLAISVSVTNQLLSTITFSVNPGVSGVADFAWDMSTFDFFGLTNPQGYSVTIVPEPSTAALLGLGVLGLAAASRRRA